MASSEACKNLGNELGWIVGESRTEVSMVLFKGSSIPQVGTYVVSQSPKGCVFGVVESVTAGSGLLTSDVNSPESVGEAIRLLRENPQMASIYVKGNVRWLSMFDELLGKGLVQLPKVPPTPGTTVYEVNDEVLERVFGAERSDSGPWIDIGHLLANEKVRYRINVNRLTRHLAVLAVTGGGKSNAVCVLARKIVDGLGGTVVIFDMHGEYGKLGLPDDKVNEVSKPGINPWVMGFDELIELIDLPRNATNQERALREAWKSATKKVSPLSSVPSDNEPALIDELRKRLEAMNDEGAQGALNRVNDLIDKYGDVIRDGVSLQLTKVIKPNMLNVFDLSGLDERAADAVVSHYLRRLLIERKRYKVTEGKDGYPTPIIVFIEEAHVLVPRDRDTLTKYWAGRVAREGRKFGIGLVIVSQRPRNVDPNVLSQTNNKIILRMVEPQDITYVQEASEELSEDLAGLLPALNPGEAVVLGSMVKLPAVVKIDLCEGKKGGGDVDVVKEWMESQSRSSGRSAADMMRDWGL